MEVDDGFVSILREQSGRAYSGWRDKVPLEYVDGALSVLADDEAACLYGCGIRGKDYPERLAMQLLRELKEKTVNTPASVKAADETNPKSPAGSESAGEEKSDE